MVAKWVSNAAGVHISDQQISRGARIPWFGIHGVGLPDIKQKSDTGEDSMTLDKQSVLLASAMASY